MKEERPNVYPVDGPLNNPRESKKLLLIKHHIISTISNCPNNSTNTHTYVAFSFFVYPIYPSTKQIFDASRIEVCIESSIVINFFGTQNYQRPRKMIDH
jgi:hypothetical protein